MSETDALGPRQTRLLNLVGGSLVACVLDFVLLVIVYLVVGQIAPGTLGDVAGRPVAFAFWVNLVVLPVRFLWVLVVSGRDMETINDTGGSPEEAARLRRRRIRIIVRDVTADVAILASGALFVASYVLDPGDAPLRQLAAVTALGPLVLVRATHGLIWLVRRRR